MLEKNKEWRKKVLLSVQVVNLLNLFILVIFPIEVIEYLVRFLIVLSLLGNFYNGYLIYDTFYAKSFVNWINKKEIKIW